jgi:hypothetical protein
MDLSMVSLDPVEDSPRGYFTGRKNLSRIILRNFFYSHNFLAVLAVEDEKPSS